MPRARRIDADATMKLSQTDVEEDYLDVDKPLPGQNYYCVSFVSPDKVLAQKELFMYYHYEQAFYKKLTNMLDTSLTSLIEKSDDGKIDVADVIKIKKSVRDSYTSENVDFEKFKSKLEDFRFRDEENIGEVFDKQNNFGTSVRGVKVRGVFDTKREADVRASVLQRMDPLFDVFVGQIGFWCPWDPNPQKIDDIEYMNNDLNKLVKEYKSNESKKDQFYNEQKTQRQKDAISADDRLKHQTGLNDMREYQKQVKEQEQKQGQSGNNTLDNLDNLNNLDNLSSLDKLSNLDKLMVISEVEEDQQGVSAKACGAKACGAKACGDNCNTDACCMIDPLENIITQSIDIGTTNSKEISIEQQSTILQCEDPWLQRKNEGK